MTQSVAQSWLVFRLTGRSFDLGVLGIVTWAPVLLGAAWGGALADRLDRRHLMMVTQALFVVVNAIQAVLVGTGRIQLWVIFTLAALNGTVMAVDSPTRQVYVFQLAGRERLASAVGLFEVVINASRGLRGPAAVRLLLRLADRGGSRAGFSLSGVAMVAVALVTWTALAIRTSVIPAPFGPSLTDAGDHGTLTGAAAPRTPVPPGSRLAR